MKRVGRITSENIIQYVQRIQFNYKTRTQELQTSEGM